MSEVVLSFKYSLAPGAPLAGPLDQSLRTCDYPPLPGLELGLRDNFPATSRRFP